MAKDVLATASYDMTVRIWDLSTGNEEIQLTGHTDTVSQSGVMFKTEKIDYEKSQNLWLI